jgi:pyrroline-5-carboxylate reductase
MLMSLFGTAVRFVRTMPNTPLLVGKGVTGVFVQDNTAKEIVEDLLKSTSQLFYCREEDDLNKVCAISGSGPAYFFLFVEALRDAGVAMGLNREDATQMAIGTCLGAGTLAANSFGKDDVAKLRENVTSKGGTTEAALNQFAAHKLREIVHDAAQAALIRGRELAKDVEMKSKL